ncbi:MAG: hypothetical protein JJ967_10205, partial [Muricauda sp.]|nr:hypothetical protein [Allomuricauda sp.]
LRDAPEIPGIPIIAVSAAAMPEDRQRIEEAGFDEFIDGGDLFGEH